MYRINRLDRPVLITPDEVVHKINASHDLDPKRILGAIEIAEERLVRNAIGRSLYEKMIDAKNVTVTATNQATLQAELATSYGTAQCVDTLKPGDVVNSLSFLDDCDKALWQRYLWKFTAEAVLFVCLPQNFFKFSSAGLSKPNPEIPVAMAGVGENVGLKLNELTKLMDIFLHSSVEPLREAMHEWICLKKSCYPLYCKPCDCNSDGVAYARKSDMVMDLYENEGDACGCPNPKSCGCK